MERLVLLALAAAWAAVLVPSLARAVTPRANPRRTSRRFRQGIEALRSLPAVAYRPQPIRSADPAPGIAALPQQRTASAVPSSPAEAAVRRRDVLVLLGLVAVVTLVVGVATGAAAIFVVHGCVDVLLATFVLLVRRRRPAATIHRLPSAPRTAANDPAANAAAEQVMRMPQAASDR